MNLDNKDALALANALQAAGVKIDGLKAVNPWSTSDTPRSREIRWMLEAASPALANKLKGDAGHESMVPSLAYAASVAAGITPDAMQGEAATDYARFNPQAVQEQQEKADQDMLAKLEQASQEMQLNRIAQRFGGDINAAKRAMDAEQQRDAERQQQAERDAKRAKELDARIAAKQQQIRQAAQIAMGNVIAPN